MLNSTVDIQNIVHPVVQPLLQLEREVFFKQATVNLTEFHAA